MKHLMCLMLLALGCTAPAKPIEFVPVETTMAVKVTTFEGGSGSAFPIANRPYITGQIAVVLVTAGHLDKPTVVQFDDQAAKVVRWRRHPTKDLALMWATRDTPVRLCFFDETLPKYGDRLYVVGFPGGEERRVTEGYAAEEVGAMSVDVAYGSSGGPVLNAKGRAVGVVMGLGVLGEAPVWFASYYVPLTKDVRSWINAEVQKED